MPKDYLWLVIHSFTSQEKRYFKRDFLKTRGMEVLPLFVQLFDVLVKQEDYDEDEILKLLSPNLTKSNLSYTKNYLFEQLCNALVIIEQQLESDARLNRELNLIRAFRRKGLYLHALKIWKKAISYARDLEKYPHVLLLKEEYRKLQLYHNPKVKQSELQQEYDSGKIFMDEISNLFELQELQFKALLMRRRAHFNLNEKDKLELEKFINAPSLQEKPKSPSFLMQHYFLNVKSILSYLKGMDECYDLAYENIIAWHNNDKYISTFPEDYIEVLYIFYYASILAKRYEHIEAVFNYPGNHALSDISHNSYFETLKFLALNRIYNIQGDYNKVSEILKTVKQNIEEWNKYVNIELIRTLYLSSGIASFALEDFEDAYYFIKQGLFLFNDQTRKEQFSFSYIFLLFICFEMKNPYMFEQQYKATYTYFYKSRKPLPFEKKILQALVKASVTNNRTDQKIIFQELFKSLEKSKSNSTQQLFFNFFNIPAWLESKIHRVPYKDWIRNIQTK
ncbi:MAG TPA: hypothetical protein VLZ83_06905 [Edaphocola sp.]|nr:hypothetical protein [Edaphocola sp.]